MPPIFSLQASFFSGAQRLSLHSLVIAASPLNGVSDDRCIGNENACFGVPPLYHGHGHGAGAGAGAVLFRRRRRGWGSIVVYRPTMDVGWHDMGRSGMGWEDDRGIMENRSQRLCLPWVNQDAKIAIRSVIW